MTVNQSVALVIASTYEAARAAVSLLSASHPDFRFGIVTRRYSLRGMRPDKIFVLHRPGAEYSEDWRELMVQVSMLKSLHQTKVIYMMESSIYGR